MSATKPTAKYRIDYTKPDFTINKIDLIFDLKPEVTTVTAQSQVVRLNRNASTLELDSDQLTLKSIKIDGHDWAYYQINDTKLVINNVPEQFTLMIINEIYPKDNTSLDGLYVSGDAMCTQCEAEGFRRITYYLDRPDVSAQFTTKIIADKKNYPYLLSNGNKIEQGDLNDDQHYAIWYDPFPKPSYLFALVAGDFDKLSDEFVTRSNRKVQLEIFVDKGNLDRTSWAMQSLKASMKWDEERFNLEYDLDIFMIVAVDFFNMGAMENKGLNIFNSKYVLAKPETATDEDYIGIESVIGHEYFHNWTGNRVTCRDWFQLSLKEGLTVFRDQEFSADMGSRAVKRIDDVRTLRTVQFAEDASPMAHPIRPEKVIEMNNFYTVTVYEKGAEVIRMIHTLLGERLFQAGMKLYFERHDGSAATCDDFVQAMQDASNVDLSKFKRWYSQSGTPKLTFIDAYDEENRQYHLTIEQETKPTADQKEKLPLHIPVAVDLYDQNSGQKIPLSIQNESIDSILNLTESSQTWIFDAKNKPILASLRDFSAPVTVEYNYSEEELLFLMQYAENSFHRYDAVQRLFAMYIKQGVSSYKTNLPIELPELVMAGFKRLLKDDSMDRALLAQLLTLPTENELANLFDAVDPEAIHFIRLAFVIQIGTVLFDELFACYCAQIQSEYKLNDEAMAKRSLKNACLYLLVFSEEEREAMNCLVEAQYIESDNMTDKLAALNCATKADLPCAETLLQQFDEQWHHDGLVMDKWFTMQATRSDRDALNRVKLLLDHRSFSLSNPNRVRGLIGSFVNNNPANFHQKEGEGYAFLVQILSELNKTNPQIAARLVEPLIRFKRYEESYQSQMKQALQELSKLPQLSGDLYEKITKALD